MATKTVGTAKVVTGGTKTRPWVRYFIAALQAKMSAPKQAKGSSASQPLGGSVTVIPNVSNPLLHIQADDVSVQAGGAPRNNPTVAAGEATAPAIAAVIADSGEMAAGTYYFEATLCFDGASAAGKAIKVEHRNAANAATLAVLGRCPCGGAMGIGAERIVLAASERVRVIVGAVAGAASEVAQAQVRLYKLGA